MSNHKRALSCWHVILPKIKLNSMLIIYLPALICKNCHILWKTLYKPGRSVKTLFCACAGQAWTSHCMGRSIIRESSMKRKFSHNLTKPNWATACRKEGGELFFCLPVFSDMLIMVVSYRTQSESHRRSINPTAPPGAQWSQYHHVCWPLAPKGPSNMCALLPVSECASLQTSLML